MSEFLKDLLKKVKQNADSMEPPVTEGVPDDDVILEAPPPPQKRTKPGLATKPPKATVTSAKPGLVETTKPSIADIPSSPEAYIKGSSMKFELAIFDLMTSLTDGELRFYLAFIKRTYGQKPPINTCFITSRQLGAESGVTSPNSHVKILQSLEHKHLIKRLSKATGKGQASSFRVFLPSETRARRRG